LKTFFSYVVPLIGICFTWDSFVSFARLYTEAELRKMASDAGGSHYSALTQINAKNVGKLKQAWRYDIKPHGALTNKPHFCALGSDGMTIDAEGNLYLTGHGVTVFDRDGKKVDHIDVPEKWTANVCLSGPDRRTLFITASESLYSIRLRVKGANPAK